MLNTDINTALNGGTSVDLTASGSIEVAANISKTAGSDATLTLAAGTDITIDSSVAISSTTGKLNTILDADTALGGGAIVMNTGSSITSNGGNITLAGGIQSRRAVQQFAPATGAVGDNVLASYCNGVYLSGASLRPARVMSIIYGTGGPNAGGGALNGVAGSALFPRRAGNITHYRLRRLCWGIIIKMASALHRTVTHQ